MAISCGARVSTPMHKILHSYRACLQYGLGSGRIPEGPDVFNFNAAISACEKGVQWQRVAPLFVVMHRPGP
eukprot:10303487-Karenia_brevis.AAC.1